MHPGIVFFTLGVPVAIDSRVAIRTLFGYCLQYKYVLSTSKNIFIVVLVSTTHTFFLLASLVQFY